MLHGIFYLTFIKVCCDRFHCDEHVGGSRRLCTSSSSLLGSSDVTFLWLVYEQIKVSFVLFSQVALEVKRRHRGQGLASGLGRHRIFPSCLGFAFRFDLRFGLRLRRFGLGLGFAGRQLWLWWAGWGLLIERNDEEIQQDINHNKSSSWTSDECTKLTCKDA